MKSYSKLWLEILLNLKVDLLILQNFKSLQHFKLIKSYNVNLASNLQKTGINHQAEKKK